MPTPALSPHALLAAVDAGHVWRAVDNGPSHVDVGDEQVDVTAEVRAAERAGLVALGERTAGGRSWRLTGTGRADLARLASGAARVEPDGPVDPGVLYLATTFGVVASPRDDGPLAPVVRVVHRHATAAADAHRRGDGHDDVVAELLHAVFEMRDQTREAA